MRYPPRTPRRFSDKPHAPAAPPAQRQQAPLGEDRFKQLIHGASAFFAAAERDMDAERAAAIVEIQALMREYGLTISDLVD